MDRFASTLAHCRRDQNGLLKLSDLWSEAKTANYAVSALLKRNPELSKAVVMHRTGRSNQGAYAPEDVVRKFAQLIQRKHLWQASDQRHAPVEVVDTVEVSNAQAPEQRIDTHDGVNSVEVSNAQLLQADLLSESDVSAQLSILLHRPVQFRLRITPNKELALIDVAIIFTGLDNKHAAQAVRRLLDQFPDIASTRSKFKFPGRGRQTVDVAPLAEALEFAFLLPGRAASKVRKEAAKLLVRYIGGDLSLIDEVCQLNRVQVALAKIPEDERTAEQQTARIFAETVENTTTTQLTIAPASQKEPLRILPPPDGLIPTVSQRDAYVMRITDQNDPSASIWKIGRSDDPLARAISLRSEVKRDRGWDWQHDVELILRGAGIMESLFHREFAQLLIENTKEYFRGNQTFPHDVAAAFSRLLPQQFEIQYQEKRRAETRFGAEDEAPFKKRRLELELAKEELQQSEAETRAFVMKA